MSGKEKTLRFPCDCISAIPACEEPWARVAKDAMFKDGTKEVILNRLHESPQTVAQLAKSTNLAQPTVHRHLNELLRNKLIRLAEKSDKKYVVERYYRLNFPVVTKQDETTYAADLETLADEIADLFSQKLDSLEQKYRQTDAAQDGWTFSEFLQYIFHSMQRKARQQLERNGTLNAKLPTSDLDFVLWAQE